MTIHKLLTHGRLSEPFFRSIQDQHPDITFIHTTSDDDLKAQIQEVDGYAGFYHFQNMDVSHLKWIHSFGAGVEGFFTNESIVNSRIPISRTKGDLAQKMGEFCLAHVLSHYQHLSAYQQQQFTKSWIQHEAIDLVKSNVLIMGTGIIGQGIAEILYPLVGQVIGINSSGKLVDGFHQTHTLDQLTGLASQMNVVINALPDPPATKNYLNNSFFQHFQNSLFLNIGRGPTLDLEGLNHALANGNVNHAILDVFTTEPLDPSSDLWKHPGITITPHVSGLTSISDLTTSFDAALGAFKSNEVHPPMFVDYNKGY